MTNNFSHHEDISISPEYCAVEKMYGDRKIPHTDVLRKAQVGTGLAILDYLEADFHTKKAYCLTPMLQDQNTNYMKAFIERHGCRDTVFYAGMCFGKLSEYTFPDNMAETGIKISAWNSVNQMVLAHIIQSKYYFNKYHAARYTHKHVSDRNKHYGKWLSVFDISQKKCDEILKYLES